MGNEESACQVCGRIDESIRKVEMVAPLQSKERDLPLFRALSRLVGLVGVRSELAGILGPRANTESVVKVLCRRHRLVAGLPNVQTGPSAELLEGASLVLRQRGDTAGADKAEQAAKKLWKEAREDLEDLERLGVDDSLRPED
jgi:hypothetical protein